MAYQVSRQAPPNLGSAGLALWREYHIDDENGEPVFVFSVAERQNLIQACRVADRLAEIEKAMRVEASVNFDYLTSTDNGGKRTSHPLIAEMYRGQKLLSDLLRQVPIPPMDVEGSDSGQGHARSLQEHQRAAGKARWANVANRGAGRPDRGKAV